MPCAGCLRRRKKIKAAMFALRKGLAATKEIYRFEREKFDPQDRPKAVSIHDLGK